MGKFAENYFPQKVCKAYVLLITPIWSCYERIRKGRARRDKETHVVRTHVELGRHMRLGFVSVQELQRASVDDETRAGDLEVSYSHTAQSDQGC